MYRAGPLVLAFALLFVPLVAVAQGPATPIDQLTLSIEDGNGYSVLTDAAGVPQRGTLHQVVSGVFPEDMAPVVVEFYTRTGAQDVYITFVNLVPPGVDPREAIATGIELRVLTFGTPEGAATYVNDFSQEWPRQAEALGLDPGMTPVDDLPDHDGAICGFTATDPLHSVDTGDYLGEVPYTRILAQHGSTVASAKVVSPDNALNRLMAIELLSGQLACIEDDAPCAPVPPPVEFPHSATPEADAGDATANDTASGGAAPASGTAIGIMERANSIRTMPSAFEVIALPGEPLAITGAPVGTEGFT